jgi:hypothetical protein
MKQQDQIVYGRTPEGQLLYDLAFTNLSIRSIARKHRAPVARIRFLRASSEIRKLRKQVRQDRHERA